ncbi:uncharacterized protein LOC114950471 [Acropora millepora]|uniref:uncharacterized protein LOC114950471 n=1 Tax=Acropora millepora TaxID=45264 RepID=UPI001CF3C3D3|nr:uncharacterized protein LOC114950471 [Acropora millepora]
MKCAVNSNRSLLEARIDVHTNNICCNDPECVLPSCINEKLQNMNTIINKAKPKKERKQKKRNNDHLWDQDLDDILNIFAFNNSGNTCNDPFTTHATNEIETGEKLVHKRRAPSSRNEFSDPSPLFGNTSACQTALSPGNDWQLMNLAPTQSTPTSEVTFSAEETLPLDGALSNLVFTTPDIMGNITQPVGSLSCSEKDQYKNFAVFSLESRPSSMKSKSQSKNRDGCGTKRKVTPPKQCTRKLFRILSLILQVFENNLNAELEERYALVLEGALRDIQNAHCHLKKSTTGNLC